MIYYEEIISCLNPMVYGEKVDKFSDVSIDTRTIKGGELFFALKGEKFDGHDFVKEAFKRGALGAVIEKENLNLDLGNFLLLKVENTMESLWKLAQHHRRNFKGKLLAITGSVGKTTTKELTSQILQYRGKVHKNEGNQNNHIGVPLTLLRFDPDKIDYVIVEMGCNHFGEIRFLTEISEPDYGFITRIGEAHLEGLISIEGVKKAKGELFETMKVESTRIVNIDDPYIKDIRFIGNKITLGEDKEAELRLDSYKRSCEGWIINFDFNGEKFEAFLNMPSEHHVFNGFWAAALSWIMGAQKEDILKGLSRGVKIKGRLNIIEKEDIIVIDDAYNANPESIRAAVEFTVDFAKEKGLKHIVLVLGDMRELGSSSYRLHKELGEFLKRFDIEMLVTVGSEIRVTGEVWANSINLERWRHYNNVEELLSQFSNSSVLTKTIYLVKGSHAVGLEKFVDFLFLQRSK